MTFAISGWKHEQKDQKLPFFAIFLTGAMSQYCANLLSGFEAQFYGV
jgi:hypothetical protein